MMAYYPVKEDAPLPKGEWGKTMFKNRNNTNIPIANEKSKNRPINLAIHILM